jgi:hypothetical protein
MGPGMRDRTLRETGAAPVRERVVLKHNPGPLCGLGHFRGVVGDTATYVSGAKSRFRRACGAVADRAASRTEASPVT